ncbi:dipeptidase [Candidatus Uabimicrobium sp. HlEnr_7]|uniref:dipeptidase n=1 Tax=Candidatus Uabimicrobium helgolandensis TaxID=3095367 RepID=UPI003555F819
MFDDKKLPIFDGHNDSLLRFFYKHRERKSFFNRHNFGHIDFPRIKEANFIGGFFALFVPPIESPNTQKNKSKRPQLSPPIEMNYAYKNICAQLDYLDTIAEHQQVFLVKKSQDLQKCYTTSSLGVVLHLEGASAIKDFLTLEYFYQRGLRSLGLVWSRANKYGVGAPFAFPHTPDIGPGLTPLGKELVHKCNEMGIVVDLAHLNEQGFWDAAKISSKPLIVTHSAVHAICPSSRNLTDSQIKAVADSGGVIGINLGVMFIRRDGKIKADTSIEDIVAHFEYIINLVGAQHVAFGSDLDGIYISPQIQDVVGLHKVLYALREKGYSADSLQKIAYQNWFRVLKDTLVN